MRGLLALKQKDDDWASSNDLGSDGEISSSGSSSSGSDESLTRSTSVLFGRLREEYSFGLADLAGMKIMTVLAAWHSMSLWITACVLMCEVLQKLLKGYVQWMRLVMMGYGTVSSHLSLYVATLLRSWFVVLFYADLVRFCYWLGRDAWRPDAFEAYRRAVVGLGEVEMASGDLHYDENGMPRGWPAEGLTRKKRIFDYCMQAVIYLTLDVWPICAAIHDYQASRFGSNSVTMVTFLATLTAEAGMAGLVHAFIFKIAWTYTDLRMKYTGFKKAWAQGSRDVPGDAGDDCKDGVENGKGVEELQEVVSFLPDKPNQDVGDACSARPRGGSAASNVLTDEMIEILKDRVRVATRQNICVRICKVMHLVMPHVFWISLFISGVYVRRPLVIILALCFASYRFGIGAINVAKASGSLPTAEKKFSCLKGRRQRTKLVWALQAWGETCCGLEYTVQLERRVTFTVMVGLQTVLFCALGWWKYISVCTFLVILQMVQLTVYCQVPWGWLVALVEAALIFLGTTVLAVTSLEKKKQAIETILFVLAHQCGLARKTYLGSNGKKVVQIVFVLLFVAITVVLAATTLTVESELDSTDDYTMLCDNCTYYRVPYMSRQQATGLACPAWFHLGNRDVKLSLSDFGLMSKIAYESNATIRDAMSLLFPGWSLLYSKRMEAGDAWDWTTFFEFGNGTTSVFVVRGTSTALDALNDMIIWMPAAVMQLFNGLGPDMLSPVARAIGRLSKVFGHLDNSNYVELESYVVGRMKTEPNREYYITGHSLGGGLAKIVSLKALVDGLDLPAVTFMSPGLLATQYLVSDQLFEKSIHGQMTQAYLRDNELAVTVMPENDIVSRIDTQTGQTVSIGCTASSPLTCHLMGQGLCTIFWECGSGRRNQDLFIPCGLCGEDTKCIPGVDKQTFKTKRSEENRWDRR